MANQSPSPSNASPTNITDLDVDSLARCADYLSLQDISNMAMASRFLKKVAYSDSIWLRFFRERWPQEILPKSSHIPGVREAYLARRTALLQFKFVDPLVADFYAEPKYFDHILLDKNDLIFTQGSLIQTMNIDSFLSGSGSVVRLNDHKARITCMRLFPLNETSLFRGETQREENILVTSSCDHSIRLWWKGASQRCFRGHNGAVTTMSDKLLGDGIDKILASGGEDGTVRLWSLGSSGKRGQQALRATLYGHVKPIALMSVAGHKSSLLATISKDSKVRVWDVTTSSAVRSSCCVGMTSVPGTPVSMKCHEALLYVAAGSSVAIIDLRTMQKVNNAPKYSQKLYSFAVMPSKSLFCTGGVGKAMLWDVRRDTHPVAELDGHAGSVTLLHMDQYKIVTGGPSDIYVNAWEADTGGKTNSLMCCPYEDARTVPGCSAISVDGYRIVTAANDVEGILLFRDFSNATSPVLQSDNEPTSKFWGQQSFSGSENSDEEKD
ncbi:hypothetical protein SLA2020_098470 [Shorea laevis]